MQVDSAAVGVLGRPQLTEQQTEQLGGQATAAVLGRYLQTDTHTDHRPSSWEARPRRRYSADTCRQTHTQITGRAAGRPGHGGGTRPIPAYRHTHTDHGPSSWEARPRRRYSADTCRQTHTQITDRAAGRPGHGGGTRPIPVHRHIVKNGRLIPRRDVNGLKELT